MTTDIHVPISPGELIDKITILQIKSERMTDPAKVANVRVELNLLESTWRESAHGKADIAAEWDALKKINEKLWVVEDDIRDKERAKEFDATIGFDIAGESYRAELKDGRLPIRRDDIGDAQVTFRAPAAPLLAAVFYGKVPPEELAGQGIRIDGDRALAERFVDLFHLPAKVG